MTALREMLRRQGFDDPERWIDYAHRHEFRQTPSVRLAGCPDCGARSFRSIGRYVYYSTLMTLRLCDGCGLAYADTRIDPAVLHAHFERAYKSEEYFLEARRRIFEQLAGLVARLAPRDGSVLDVGGAKGHLMAAARRCRPDLRVTVHDVSESACAWAASAFGFQTICGTVTALERLDASFDVVVMSDVIYYEPDVARLWKLLPGLVAPRGAVLIRVPNRLQWIRLGEFLGSLVRSRRAQETRDRITLFNPEHLYVYSRGLLLRRLRTLGFGRVEALPSELPAAGARSRLLPVLHYVVAKAAHRASFGKWILTPSVIIVGRRAAQTQPT